MADIITRLKVDSSEYESKIKRAAQGIQHFVQSAHNSGEQIGLLGKETREYVDSLGKMATVSGTARGRLAELTAAFTDLKTVYNSLSDEEKNVNGGFGQRLNQQLEILKGRISEAKTELQDIDNELKNNGQAASQSSSMLDNLASKFTINVDALKLFDYGLQAVNGALNVAKDAFMSSEANVDEWGRTVAASESAYQSFLNALNTGDISGFLGRIDEIVAAARTAYNELDRLGTMKTIQAPQMSAQQTENERLRMMIQTGRYIAPVDGRQATMKDGQMLTKEQIQNIERMLQNGMKTVVSLVGNEVKQTSKAIDAVYDRQAKELGLSLSEFRKGTSSMAEFDKRMEGFGKYQQWRAQHTTIDQQSGREIVARGNPYEQYAKWGTFRVDGERYGQLVQLIQQRDQQAGQAYSMQSQAYRTMNRAEGITVNKLMGRGGGGGAGGTKQEQTEFQQNQQKINTLTQEYVRLGDDATDAARQRQEEIQKEIQLLERRNGLLGLRMEQAQGRMTLTGDAFSMSGLSNTPGTLLSAPSTDIPTGGLQLGDKQMRALEKNLAKQQKNVGDIAKEWGSVASAIGAVGNAMAGIEDPAAKVLGIVAQAIATVALTFAKSLDKTLGPWDWIAAVAAGTASMISTISAIHSATGYAEGGLVKGNSYSGDNLMAMGPDGGLVGLNAGELVLNKSQQNNLANALQTGGMQALQLTATIRGEQIRLALNNNGRRTGRGEYVQSKNLG